MFTQVWFEPHSVPIGHGWPFLQCIVAGSHTSPVLAQSVSELHAGAGKQRFGDAVIVQYLPVMPPMLQSASVAHSSGRGLQTPVCPGAGATQVHPPVGHPAVPSHCESMTQELPPKHCPVAPLQT
jgi:hypothetical protein